MTEGLGERSGSEVSKVESDIEQTVKLADTIVTLIREPVTLLYQNITKAQALRRSLGSWEGEARDGNGHYRIPVLLGAAFDDHLVSVDGMVSAPPQEDVKPSSKIPGGFQFPWAGMQHKSTSANSEFPPAGTACWGYFLFALGIRPGKGVASWRPSIDGFISTQNGGIEMEVDGSVLCHIINLYSTTLNPDPWGRSWPEELPDRRKRKQCDFPFGKLSWDTIANQIHAHFTPGVESSLASVKQPFGVNGSLMQPKTIMASYYTALIHGVSDRTFQLAHPGAPILERIDRLTTCFDALHSRFQEDPLLISSICLDEAARVKRKLLAQGGDDHSFFEDVCETIDNELSLKDRAKHIMRIAVRKLFLLDDETFIIEVPGMRSESAPMIWHVTPIGLADATLGGYQSQPAGSWKRGLFEMRERVIKVLKVPNHIVSTKERRLQLLEFTAESELWNQKVLLGAPVLPGYGLFPFPPLE